MKLNIKATTLTFAIIWGVGLFLLTWWMILMDGPSTDPNLISKVYRGYTITPLGSLIGFLWAFVDGAFGGACIAWIYNSLVGNDKK
jgi:hypothetical protein